MNTSLRIAAEIIVAIAAYYFVQTHSPITTHPSITTHPLIDWKTLVGSNWTVAAVADLDRGSKVPSEYEWRSVLKTVSLRLDADMKFRAHEDNTREIFTGISRKGRGAEMSELIFYDGNLLTFCDSTGLVFRVDGDRLFLRLAIADGNGKEEKPFKTEWATTKDGLLHVGSMGKEWVQDGFPLIMHISRSLFTDSKQSIQNGEYCSSSTLTFIIFQQVLHHNMEWIKVIDTCGVIRNLDWTENYQALRRAVNCTSPGYLSHEAVAWHPQRQRWIFAPRRASTDTPYSEGADENLGTNLLLLADETFTDIQVHTAGELRMDIGVTSIKLIPDTDVIVALKVYERANESFKTWLTVFDVEGNILSDPPLILVDSEHKFEGIEFVATERSQ